MYPTIHSLLQLSFSSHHHSLGGKEIGLAGISGRRQSIAISLNSYRSRFPFMSRSRPLMSIPLWVVFQQSCGHLLNSRFPFMSRRSRIHNRRPITLTCNLGRLFLQSSGHLHSKQDFHKSIRHLLNKQAFLKFRGFLHSQLVKPCIRLLYLGNNLRLHLTHKAGLKEVIRVTVGRCFRQH